MKKFELKTIIKNKAVITGVVCFIAGGMFMSGDTGIAEQDYKTMQTKVEQLEGSNKELEEKVSNLTSTNTTLEAKVKEAKPFFDMDALKQQEIAKEVEAKEVAAQKEADKKKAEEEAKKLEESKVKLGNGNFVAGEDFDAGTYDIVAISGGGNVSSSNMFNGGLNAVMGVEDNEFYEKEYKNIKLPAGTTLKVSGVKIELIPRG